MTQTMIQTLPAYRPERVIELLEEFAANPDEYDVKKVAEELRFLFSEQAAEETRKERQLAGE